MKRRNFIKFSSLAISTSGLLSGCQNQTTSNHQKSIKSFIVSDAHIGWRGKHQPTIEQQANAVSNIVSQFNDLDLTFDTGDVHHGYLNEKQRIKARTQWLEHIANPLSKVPFHYIPGNHELGKGFMDPEIIACSFGSIPHRPYYAFDYMGIHFISLPELQSTILISKESINWLKLDLQLNKDKTTVILSHNSLKGTTFDNNETGYRCLTNTDEINHILSQNLQVKAWFHGHNHHYEVVEVNNVIHTSNGRIGGFSPPKNWGHYGQGHLGGIYFEIDATGISVKAFSATKGQFLDQLGYPNLSLKIKSKTSFDPNQPFNFYHGNGNTLDRIKQTISHHYVSAQNLQLVYADTDSIINDNADLSYETKYFFSNKKVEKIIGYQMNSNKIAFENTEFGLIVSNPQALKSFHMSFPTQKNKKNGNYKRGSYFRTQWEQAYQLIVDLETNEQQISDISLEIQLFDEKYKLIETQPKITKSITNKRLIFALNTGKKTEDVNHIYMFFKLFFKNCLEEIRINKIQLMPTTETTSKQTSGHLKYNGEIYPLNADKNPQLIELNKPKNALSTLVFKNKKHPSTCFVLKQPAIEWQIRNGTGYYDVKKTLHVNPQNHHFNDQVATIITPMTSKILYVSACDINKPIHITFIHERHIQIVINDVSDLINFSVYSLNAPIKLIGAKLIKSHLNYHLCQPTHKTIEIEA